MRFSGVEYILIVTGQWVDIWFQQELVKVRTGFLSVMSRTLLRGGVGVCGLGMTSLQAQTAGG